MDLTDLNEGLGKSIKTKIGDTIDTLCRKMGVKATKGKPKSDKAPKWATYMAQTEQGAWHWLDKKSVIDDGKSDHYFPEAKRTEFSGFVSDGKKFKKSLEKI